MIRRILISGVSAIFLVSCDSGVDIESVKYNNTVKINDSVTFAYAKNLTGEYVDSFYSINNSKYGVRKRIDEQRDLIEYTSYWNNLRNGTYVGLSQVDRRLITKAEYLRDTLIHEVNYYSTGKLKNESFFYGRIKRLQYTIEYAEDGTVLKTIGSPIKFFKYSKVYSERPVSMYVVVCVPVNTKQKICLADSLDKVVLYEQEVTKDTVYLSSSEVKEGHYSQYLYYTVTYPKGKEDSYHYYFSYIVK